MEIKHTNLEKRNIRVGIILSVVALAISIVVNIYFIPHLLSIVGDTQYGLYSFATSMTSMLLVLSFGMTSSYIRFATIAEKEKSDSGLKRVNGVFALLFLVVSIASVIIGGIIVFLFASNIIPLTGYSDTERKIIIWCLSFSTINVAINFINYIFGLFINYRMRFTWARTLSILVSLATPLLTSFLILIFDSIIVFVIVELVVNAVALLANFLYSYFGLKYRADTKIDKTNKNILSSIIYFSFFIFLVTIVTEINANTDKILLGFFADADSVAYYQLGLTFVNYVSLTATIICSTYVPLVNRFAVTGDNGKINQIFLNVSKKMILAYLVFFGGFVAAGKDFIYAWVADEEPKRIIVYYIGSILMLISLIPLTSNMASEIQRSQNKHKVRAIVLLIGALLNLGLTALFLAILPNFVSATASDFYIYQIGACLAATLISTLIFNIVIMTYYNYKHIQLKMGSYYRYLLNYLFLTTISVFAVFLIFHFLDISFFGSWIRTIIKGGTFVIIFAIVFLLFNRKLIISFIRPNKGVLKRISNAASQAETIISLSDNFIAFVITDVEKSFDDLVENKNKYPTIFAEPFFAFLKSLHESHNLSFTLVIKDLRSLRKIAHRWKRDFADNVSWIKFAFGGGRHAPYDFVNASLAKEDYERFVALIMKMTSSRDAIDTISHLLNRPISLSALNDLSRNVDAPMMGSIILSSYADNLVDEDRYESHAKYVFDRKAKMVYARAAFWKDEDANDLDHHAVIVLSRNNFYANKQQIKTAFDDFASFVSKVSSTLPVQYACDNLFDAQSKEPIRPKILKKIAIINTYNRFSTGTMIQSLVKGAAQRGYRAKLFYGRLYDEYDDKSVFFGASNLWNALSNIYVKLFGQIGGGHYFETKRLIRMLKHYNPDIINLHNIHGNYVNHRLLFTYLKNKKVVVTMHDCFMLTGRCAHFADEKNTCNGWLDECRKCPYLSFYPSSLLFDKAHELYIKKREFISECEDLVFVAISDWIKQIAVKSGINEDKIVKIANGINIHHDAIRHDVSERTKKRIIGVATLWANQKGLQEFNYLAEQLDPHEYEIVLIGRILKKDHVDGRIVQLGLCDSQSTLNEIANSDLLVLPTYVDTFPTVLIEALFAGTPVLSYDVGGCKEITGDCGLFVEKGDRQGLVRIIEQQAYLAMSKDKIRQRATLFTEEAMISSYMDLFDGMMNHD